MARRLSNSLQSALSSFFNALQLCNTIVGRFGLVLDKNHLKCRWPLTVCWCSSWVRRKYLLSCDEKTSFDLKWEMSFIIERSVHTCGPLCPHLWPPALPFDPVTHLAMMSPVQSATVTASLLAGEETRREDTEPEVDMDRDYR